MSALTDCSQSARESIMGTMNRHVPWCAFARVPSTFQCLHTYRRTPHLTPDTPCREVSPRSVLLVLPGPLQTASSFHTLREWSRQRLLNPYVMIACYTVKFPNPRASLTLTADLQKDNAQNAQMSCAHTITHQQHCKELSGADKCVKAGILTICVSM